MYLLEYWADIPGLPRYQASYSGKLRHQGKVIMRGWFKFDWASPRILNCSGDGGGYLKASIAIDGRKIYKKAHVLVATAFIPNPMNAPEVNHLNFDRSDNRVCNLEWVTRSQNMQHSSKAGRLKGKTGRKRKVLIK